MTQPYIPPKIQPGSDTWIRSIAEILHKSGGTPVIDLEAKKFDLISYSKSTTTPSSSSESSAPSSSSELSSSSPSTESIFFSTESKRLGLSPEPSSPSPHASGNMSQSSYGVSPEADEIFDYEKEDGKLQLELLAAQGNLVEIKIGDRSEIIHLIEISGKKSVEEKVTEKELASEEKRADPVSKAIPGIPENVYEIEALRYLRGALLFLEYNPVHLPKHVHEKLAKEEKEIQNLKKLDLKKLKDQMQLVGGPERTQLFADIKKQIEEAGIKQIVEDQKSLFLKLSPEQEQVIKEAIESVGSKELAFQQKIQIEVQREKLKIAKELFEQFKKFKGTIPEIQRNKDKLPGQETESKALTKFHNELCARTDMNSKEMALSRDLALQRLKPIPRVAIKKVETGTKTKVLVHATTLGLPATSTMPPDEEKKPSPQPQWLESLDPAWVKRFKRQHKKEIEQNGSYSSPAMAAHSGVRNGITDTTYCAEITSGAPPSNERISRVERMGLVSPFGMPSYWPWERQARIEFGVKILIDRLKPVLTTRILNHIKQYGKVYSDDQKIDFPIVYLTVLSPIFWQTALTEMAPLLEKLGLAKPGKLSDDNHFFIREKEEILARFREKISKDPSLVIHTEGELKTTDGKIIYEEKPNIVSSGSEAKAYPKRRIEINLQVKEVNNPLNRLRILSYRRNADVSQSNDFIQDVSQQFEKLIPRLDFGKGYDTYYDRLVLNRLLQRLKSPNVSLLGLQKENWNNNILSYVLMKLKKGEVKFKQPVKESKVTSITKPGDVKTQEPESKPLTDSSDDFPAIAQRELAERLEAAIHLRKINHESIFKRGSRFLMSGLKNIFYIPSKLKIPVVGGICAALGDVTVGLLDWTLNTAVPTLLRPWTWPKAWTSVKSFFNEGSGHNEQLLKTAYEILTVGSKGIVLGFCKSSDDRTSIVLAAMDAMIENPELLSQEVGSQLYDALLTHMRELIDSGLYSHLICPHTYGVKVKEVGYPYTKKCISETVLKQLNELKKFRKALKEDDNIKILRANILDERSLKDKEIKPTISAGNKTGSADQVLGLGLTPTSPATSPASLSAASSATDTVPAVSEQTPPHTDTDPSATETRTVARSDATFAGTGLGLFVPIVTPKVNVDSHPTPSSSSPSLGNGTEKN